MNRKSHIDTFGVLSLIGFALLLGFNQVVIKVTNGGIQPVFFAGIRSVGATVCVFLWLWYRGIPLRFTRAALIAGMITGVLFGAEFLLLFMALDLTGVGRTSVLFYSMPVWLAIIAHVLLPEDRITPVKSAGLGLAVAGVVWAVVMRDPSLHGSVWGDLAALGAAMIWAAAAMMARVSPLRSARPELQLWIQVAVSGPLLLAIAPLFGGLLRDVQPIHLWGLAFQIVVVVSAGFIFWLWLLSIYPASGVASFSFLSPVFGVILGWALLGEKLGPGIIGALVLVAAGIVLINVPRRQVPQKV